MDIKEVRANAKERMKGFLPCLSRVRWARLRRRNARKGGIKPGAFKNNVAAPASVLNMRLIHEVKPVTETEVLGFRLRLPVLAAPIGEPPLIWAGPSEAEYAGHRIGCEAALPLSATAPDELHEAGMPSPPKAAGDPFIKPWKARNWSANVQGPQPPEPVCSA